MEINELFNLMAEKFREFDTRLKQVELRNVTANNLAEFTDDLGDQSAGSYAYSKGKGLLGPNGVLIEGMGDAHVFHTNTGDQDFYATISVRPPTDGYDLASFMIQTWINPEAESLANWDFGSGDFTGWTGSGGGAINNRFSIQPGDDGGYQAVFECGDNPLGDYLETGYVQVKAGEYWVIEARVKRNALADSYIFIDTVSNPWGGRAPYIANFKGADPGADQWVNVTVGFRVSSPYADTALQYGLKIRILVSGGGDYAIDHVSMRKVASYREYDFTTGNWKTERTDGPDQNRNTSSSFSTQIMVLRVAKPMRINRLLWDIRNVGDYELNQLYGANANNKLRTLWRGDVASGPAEVNMVLWDPLVLTPGLYYIGLTRTTGAMTWSDYNEATYSPSIAWGAPWMFDGIYYNTTDYSFVPGCKLVWQEGNWS